MGLCWHLIFFIFLQTGRSSGAETEVFVKPSPDLYDSMGATLL
jgi:hypothetical protein